MAEVDEFLDRYPLKSHWLADITQVLNGRVGRSAHVSEIAKALWSTPERDINSIEETITRTINNYCSDAADFNKSQEFNLFERVSPATYKLRRQTNRDDILEIVGVSFDDDYMQRTWQFFSEVAKKNRGEWENVPKAEQMLAFVRNMRPGSRFTKYYEILSG